MLLRWTVIHNVITDLLFILLGEYNIVNILQCMFTVRNDGFFFYDLSMLKLVLILPSFCDELVDDHFKVPSSFNGSICFYGSLCGKFVHQHHSSSPSTTPPLLLFVELSAHRQLFSMISPEYFPAMLNCLWQTCSSCHQLSCWTKIIFILHCLVPKLFCQPSSS